MDACVGSWWVMRRFLQLKSIKFPPPPRKMFLILTNGHVKLPPLIRPPPLFFVPSPSVPVSQVPISMIGITSNHRELYMLASFKVTQMMKGAHWIWMPPSAFLRAVQSILLSLLSHSGRTCIYTSNAQITQDSRGRSLHASNRALFKRRRGREIRRKKKEKKSKLGEDWRIVAPARG